MTCCIDSEVLDPVESDPVESLFRFRCSSPGYAGINLVRKPIQHSFTITVLIYEIGTAISKV